MPPEPGAGLRMGSGHDPRAAVAELPPLGHPRKAEFPCGGAGLRIGGNLPATSPAQGKIKAPDYGNFVRSRGRQAVWFRGDQCETATTCEIVHSWPPTSQATISLEPVKFHSKNLAGEFLEYNPPPWGPAWPMCRLSGHFCGWKSKHTLHCPCTKRHFGVPGVSFLRVGSSPCSTKDET